MDPLDPAKNEESSGFSKRRISSILKAPRKSIRVPDPEQQENVVECAKPVEKRNSRRVSFAPANDVLLFSKDAKNASPARSPLQELITSTAAATQNRVQLAVTEDGLQQITGMETLLNAPLHASQQREKVNFDTGNALGEKTVLFSTDDALMDMTHSHTLNIAHDEDLFVDMSPLPTSRDKTVMFTADDGSMDMTASHTVKITSEALTLPGGRGMDLSVEKRSISSSLPPLDPDFENFLSTLFKPGGGSGVNPVNTRSTPPAGASSGETSSSVNQTRTQSAAVDKENQVPTSVPAVMEKSLNTSRRTGEPSHGRALSSKDYVGLDVKDRCSEKTIMFTAGDEFMDMTQSHTVNIASGSLGLPHGKTDSASSLEERKRETSAPQGSSGNGVDVGFKNFLASLSKTSAPSGNPVTAQVVPPSAASFKETAETNASLSQLKTDVDKENRSRNTTRSFGKSFHGGAICPENVPQVKFDAGDDCRDKTVRFTADDACMDVTRSHTVNIATHFDPRSHQNVDFIPACGEKTVRFSADDAAMDVTRSHTVNIATHLDPQSRQNVDFGEKTVRFTTDEGSMDMTASHTVKITSGSVSLPTNRSMDLSEDRSNVSSTVPSMDPEFENFLASLSKTRGPSVNTKTAPPAGASSGETNSFLAQVKTQRVDVDKENQVPSSVPAVMEKSLNASRRVGEPSHRRALCPKDDVSMDMTEAHTGRIQGFTEEEMFSHRDSRESQTAEKTRQQQSSKTLASFNPKDKTSLKNPALHASLQTHKVDPDTKDEGRNKTIMFTAGDESMDMTQSHTVNIARSSEKSFNGGTMCPENDVSMDMTEAHTGRVVGLAGSDDHFQFNFNTQDTKSAEMTSGQKNREALRSSNHTGMATPLKSSLKTKVQRHQDKFDAEDDCREKTVRFTADDACMDVTRSHTVNIATHFDLQSQKNVDVLPACGEKTVRFNADDAAMDVTKSHTVNIATHFDLQSQQNVDILPACGEKTVRFGADDAAMDVTRSHTVNIATHFDPRPRQNVDILPACGEKTVRFSADDAAMDVTRSHTVNIATDSISESVLPHQDSSVLSVHDNDNSLSVKKRQSETCRPRRNRSSSALTLDPGFKHSLSRTSGPWTNPVITKAAPAASSPQETADTNGFLDQIKTQKPDVNTEKEAPGFVSTVMENPVNKTMPDCPEDDVSMEMTEAQTGHILGETSTDEPLQYPPSTQDLYPNSDHLNKTEVTSQQSDGALESSDPDGVEITNRQDSPETDNRKEPEPRNQACSPSAVDHDVDAVSSQNSRRRSLANLCSKIRRLSHMINTAPETVDIDSCTAPVSQLEDDMDKNLKDKTKSQPAMEPELEMGEKNTQAQCLMEREQPSSTTTTPYNLKTKQIMSRLSMGSFQPKLPQRSKPDEPKKVNSEGEHTRTINVTNQLSNFDGDVSDIFDEELGSCEDMSEMLDSRSLQKATEKVSAREEFYMDRPLEEDAFEQDFVPAVQAKKRPLPEDEIEEENEKRMKGSTEMDTDFDTGLQSPVAECDDNITAAPCTATHTTDYSNNSHTASTRCEATFESTFKQSLFESQLEDYASDMQRKFDEGTVTVLEFFKLFNIDFVIHNPRQSVLPGRLLSDSDRTPMDLLKDRHINRPKQMVYETNVQNLTEKVEGLKERMQDLNKPLKIVNRPLWEEMSNSSEKELKSFGAKLKERNSFFRKMSKAQSHEMKGVLYSDLVQADLEEQQRFRGTIEEADQMIKSLDDCICELETELAAVEEKGHEDTPSLKSRQEEMQKVTEALADTERQISELEMQKKQNSNKLNRLRAETRNLERHITALHTVNEWRFGEKTDNSTAYTFLHDTFHLQLVFEKPSGNDADKQSERKISQITFKLQLDDEKSEGHACLVHKLLRQYIDGEAAWVEKHPTSRHVPKLLHDVGLVVSRCRLLGEELRLLKMWGGLRLDILNISCVDTQVHIAFSSLKKFSKFEVIFSVSLTNHLYVLQVQSFKNIIGSTTIQQIEEIVALFSPAKKLLTKIVKKIHQDLLC